VDHSAIRQSDLVMINKIGSLGKVFCKLERKEMAPPGVMPPINCAKCDVFHNQLRMLFFECIQLR